MKLWLNNKKQFPAEITEIKRQKTNPKHKHQNEKRENHQGKKQAACDSLEKKTGETK